jgi:RecA-family ATPase
MRESFEERVRRAMNGSGAHADTPPPPLPWIDTSNWDNEPVPEQKWAVLDRVPLHQVCLFSGEGAVGKSIAQLHLCAAHALGRDWLGSLPEPGPAIFVDAEDDAKVLHRRLAAVADHYQVTFSDMVDLHLISLAGHDAVLATASRSGKIEATPLYEQVLEAAGDIKPKMIGIASSANVFAGSEIERTQVQQFVSMLTRLAITADGSVVLISHPSLTGVNTDTGLSGSTAWHNAVRARFYMKGVKPGNGEQPDNDLREIVFKKNQYGPVAESIVLRYQNGLYLPVLGTGSLERLAQEAKANDLFLALLRRFTKENRNVSDRTGPGYAPAVFAREDEATQAKLDNKALEAAMRRLFKEGKIWNEPYGKASRPHYRVALK